MKKLIILLAFFGTALSLQATHLAAGQIYYRYIGGSTGVPYQYQVFLELYRDVGNNGSGTAPAPSSANICITSSCFSNATINLSKILPSLNQKHPQDAQGFALPSDYRCIESTDPKFVDVAVHVYSTITTLPGKCSDFNFSFSNCCRNQAIDNLKGPGGRDWFIQSTMNNMRGPNNAAYFVRPAFMSTCVGQSLNINQSALDKDGDSLYYQNVQPLEGISCNATGAQIIPYDSAYSLAQPVSSTSPFSIHPNLGIVSFTPSRAEVVVIKMMVSEFRFDTALSGWLQIGSVERDFQLSIADSCRDFDLSFEPVFQDTFGNGLLYCGDRILNLKCAEYFDCSTISPDGSEFIIYDSQGNLMPIVSATIPANCDSTFSKYLQLHLFDTISYNDTMTLVTRTGNDLNTVGNFCGHFEAEFDSTTIFVSDCQSGISISEDILSEHFRLFPNPASNVLQLEFITAQPKNLKIINAAGQVLFEKTFRQKHYEMTIEEWPRGIYFLSLESADNSSNTVKFLKD